MALVETPGAANANTYATLAEFKTYRANRLPMLADALSATDPECEVALIVAARSLDANFDWTGTAVDAVQALTWPRSGMMTRNGFPIPTSGATSIQQQLKDAQCELAYTMLGGSDLVSDNDALKLGLLSVKAGDVEAAFQHVNTTTSESVDMILRRMGSEFNYLSDAITGEVRRLLVPSWFNQPSIIRPILFRAR